jgi:sulfotransferase family protein
MIGRSIYGFGKRAWRRLEHRVPAPLHRAVVEYHSRHVVERWRPQSGLGVLGSSSSRPNGAREPSLATNRPLRLAFGYLDGFVRWLAQSEYTLISYDDCSRHTPVGREEAEFHKWIERATREGQRAILLQYDVDAHPEVTDRLIDTHLEIGAPANVMVLARKIFDFKLRQTGVVEYDDAYRLDMRRLEAIQKIGGVVGYHCNALNRAGGDGERALEIFHQDVLDLRKDLDIRFFSMHGGPLTEDGRCNASMPVETLANELGLTWVHNGRSLYFHATWSDGGMVWPDYRSEPSDPLDFVQSAGVGQRVRLLFHPQNYNDFSNKRFDLPVLDDQSWVRETRATIEAGGWKPRRYWSNRRRAVLDSIARYDELLEQPPHEAPIFVNGLSRSGTTLLVSMFDSHPDVAMAYESYPHYLHVPSDGGALTPEEYIYCYQCLMNNPEDAAFALLDRKPLRNLRIFAIVTKWTGMSTIETGELLRAYLSKHHRISGAREALAIIAASARFKLRANRARFWGSKCQGNFADYRALWPDSRIIYIMRNGLDILASQKHVGAFNPDPERLGRQWRDQHRNFQAFSQRNADFAQAMLRYEDLVRNPQGTIQRLCKKIGIAFHPRMTRQHEVESTLTRNPHGQLSVERIKQPIDQTAIDRWKSDLSDAEVSAFLSGCGGTKLFEANAYSWQR